MAQIFLSLLVLKQARGTENALLPLVTHQAPGVALALLSQKGWEAEGTHRGCHIWGHPGGIGGDAHHSGVTEELGSLLPVRVPLPDRALQTKPSLL